MKKLKLYTEAAPKVNPEDEMDEFEKSVQKGKFDPSSLHDPHSGYEEIVSTSGSAEGDLSRMARLGYKRYLNALETSYRQQMMPPPKHGKPLMTYGDPGVGKSEIIASFAEFKARQSGKTFVVWHLGGSGDEKLKIDGKEASVEEAQREVMVNADKYFLFIDIRVSMISPEDFLGLPNPSAPEDYLKYKLPKWILAVTNPQAQGILFFDEINLTKHEEIYNSLFGIIGRERKMHERRLSSKIIIVAAGNLGAEFAGTSTLPLPLVNRFKNNILVLNPDEWLEYAAKAGVHPAILAFIKVSPQNLYIKWKEDRPSDPYASPRSVKEFSDSIAELDAYYRERYPNGVPEIDPETGEKVPTLFSKIDEEGKNIVGEEFTIKFMEFIKHWNSFDWQAIKTVDKKGFESFDIGKMYAYLSKLKDFTVKILKFKSTKGMNDLIRVMKNNLNYDQTQTFLFMLKEQSPHEVDTTGKQRNWAGELLNAISDAYPWFKMPAADKQWVSEVKKYIRKYAGLREPDATPVKGN